MDITFHNKKLLKQSQDYRKCLKEMGKLRADLYMMRLNQLHDADVLDDVRNLPGHFHELTSDRKGQFACDLDQPYRLIFEPHEEPIPTDKDGKCMWLEIKGVEIIEIDNYHGK